MYTYHIYRVMYAPLFESQLPRYGEKKTWVGTTGAGQNCPERESESLGEDIFSHFFEDGIFVLVSSFSFPDLSQVNRPVLQHL